MARLVDPLIPAGTISSTDQPSIGIDDRIGCRPWEPQDASQVLKAYRDPTIQRWHHASMDSLTDAEEWIVDTHQEWNSEKTGSWAIVEQETELAVGRVKLYFDLEDARSEITYWVLPEWRGQGISARAGQAVCNWVLSIGINRIDLQHSTQNPASSRVAKKLGFSREGILRESCPHLDGMHDMVLHSLLASDPAVRPKWISD